MVQYTHINIYTRKGFALRCIERTGEELYKMKERKRGGVGYLCKTIRNILHVQILTHSRVGLIRATCTYIDAAAVVDITHVNVVL